MKNVPLKQVLALAGKLDDSTGGDTARERLRSFLKDNVQEVGQVRDYIEECLRTSGEQYARALQDLVNYVGRFLGFEVRFGRYHGVQGQLGFDGHWQSPTGFHVVVEAKTTEVYAIKTNALVGYVDGLISEKTISSWDGTLGLYVIGRPDPEIQQLENAIIAEKRTHQLRVVSTESLLSLAEMMSEYDVGHEDVLAVLRPSGPRIDPVVDLMARLVAQEKETDGGEEQEPTAQEKRGPQEQRGTQPIPPRDEKLNCWMTPVKSDAEQTAEEIVQRLVGGEHIYAIGERTPGRKHLKPGDLICFYATATGVIAHGTVKTHPEEKAHPKVRDPERYGWVFELEETRLYEDSPVVIDSEVRSQLDAFKGRDLNKGWSWFVQATRKITRRDFDLLTRR